MKERIVVRYEDFHNSDTTIEVLCTQLEGVCDGNIRLTTINGRSYDIPAKKFYSATTKERAVVA